MNWKKRVLALFCAAVVLLTLWPRPAQASNDIIFIALNDQMVSKLTASTMPIYYYYSYYVPYVIFDTNYMTANFSLNVDLGIRVAATNNKITLYNKRRQLTYDLDAGTCTDKDGNNYKRAAVVGGITYLPIASVRDYFAEDGLSYSQLSTEYGVLLRLTTPSVSLSDDIFADAAASGMPAMIRDYNRVQTPSPSPSPSVSPSPSPSPSPTPGQSSGKRGVNVYLSFQCSGGENTAAVLDLLEREGIPALFFFSPDALAENEAIIRRIVGGGHAVGLTVPGGPTEDAKALLAEGNRLLELIAHINTRTLTLKNGDRTVASELSAQGWSVWTSNVPVAPKRTASAYSAALMRTVDAKNSVARLLLSDSALTAATLPLLVNALREETYSLRLAVGSEVS